MQRLLMNDLRKHTIQARDGRIGSVKDAYFDDERWVIRYLVVDTGTWLPGRKVLISPASLRGVDDETIIVDLTRQQIEDAPDVGEKPTVSRLYEEAHAHYYGYPFYWVGADMWGDMPFPMTTAGAEMLSQAMKEDEHRREEAAATARDTHLRSGAEVVGYGIEAADGAIGHVDDFLIDDRRWAIEAMVVDTRNWLPGKKVKVPPRTIRGIDWDQRRVEVHLTRDSLEHAPAAP